MEIAVGCRGGACFMGQLCVCVWLCMCLSAFRVRVCLVVVCGACGGVCDVCDVCVCGGCGCLFVLVVVWLLCCV